MGLNTVLYSHEIKHYFLVQNDICIEAVEILCVQRIGTFSQVLLSPVLAAFSQVPLYTPAFSDSSSSSQALLDIT